MYIHCFIDADLPLPLTSGSAYELLKEVVSCCKYAHVTALYMNSVSLSREIKLVSLVMKAIVMVSAYVSKYLSGVPEISP
jgi:hypothetical protein